MPELTQRAVIRAQFCLLAGLNASALSASLHMQGKGQLLPPGLAWTQPTLLFLLPPVFPPQAPCCLEQQAEDSGGLRTVFRALPSWVL